MNSLRILVLALLILVCAAPVAWGRAFFLQGQAAPPAGQGIVVPPPKPGAPKAPAVPTVQLSTGPYTPAAGVDPRLTRALAAKGTQGQACLLLCRAPAQAAISEELTRLGVQVLGVYPDYTYIVRVQARHLEPLLQRSWVHWVGMLPAANKLAAHLGPAVEGENTYRWQERVCAVNVYDAADADVVGNRLANAGVEVESWLPLTRTFICRVQAREQAAVAAEWGEVSFVEPVPVAHPDLLESVALCGHADYARAYTTYGETVVFGMIDTGFVRNHILFTSPATPYLELWSDAVNASADGADRYSDPSGHGTHMAGIMLGRAAGGWAGMCPWACTDGDHYFRPVRCATVTDPNTLVNVEGAMDYLRSTTALLINCSWSNGGNTGLDLTARTVDTVVWNFKQIYVCSAGNGGPAAGSIGGPGAAKNAIAVGSVSKDSDLAISTFSGRGPTADYRGKPDVYAPGEGIVSADASAYGLLKEVTGCSAATAHVTGALATMLGHYTNASASRPATVKAALMATATHKGDLTPARTGVLNSYELHSFGDTSDSLYGYSAEVATSTSYLTWSYDVPANVADMWVVLTWIEPAPLEGATDPTYDDIDLYVDVGGDHPSGGGEFYSTGTADTVEAVHLVSPSAGHYHFNAYRYTASQPYAPGLAIYVRYAGTPAAPTALTAAQDETDIVLTWTHGSTNESGFHLYHRTSSSDPWELVGEAMANATTWRHQDPEGGKTHSYQVKAYNANGESAASNTASYLLWNSEDGPWGAPYGNNWVRRGVITVPGATQTRVRFSSGIIQTNDSLTSSAGDHFTGNLAGLTSTAAAGDTITLELQSDASVTGSFAVGRVEWLGTATGPAKVDGPLFGLSSFDDVATTAGIWLYVEAIYREGITAGCQQQPPLYCPDSPVTRGQMAVFLCRAAGWTPLTPVTPSFTDVPKTSGQYGYVEAIRAHGVTAGCTPTTYCPNAPVTRGQMAVFLCRAAGIATQSPATPTFTDVPSTSQQYTYIEGMYTAAITVGCVTTPPRQYCPSDAVNRGQMAVFLCRAFHINAV